MRARARPRLKSRKLIKFVSYSSHCVHLHPLHSPNNALPTTCHNFVIFRDVRDGSQIVTSERTALLLGGNVYIVVVVIVVIVVVVVVTAALLPPPELLLLLLMMVVVVVSNISTPPNIP